MLSIIIPARNEADNLKDILNYFEENLLEVDFEVLLINDFSDDQTLSKAEKIFKSKNSSQPVINFQGVVRQLSGSWQTAVRQL